MLVGVTYFILKMTIKSIDAGNALPLMESFYSIQGEGFNSGKSVFFIRLAGCDVGCHWCDVKESWDINKHSVVPTNQLIEEAIQYPAKAVVITGGEPLMHNLDYLTNGLKDNDIKTFIETSGTQPLTGIWDWVCVSPKKFKPALPEVLSNADELKIIIFNKTDFEWAEEFVSQVPSGCKLYLQPEWDKRDIVTPLIIEYVKNNPKWEISLQIHKYLDIR
jgi:7-carboxy-7-deazaguanine synthase